MHAQERPTWAADLWAAGLCFHCCLVGELPLHGAEAMKLLRCWDSKVKRKSCCLPVAAFKDTYGWVKPDTAIAHPCAAARVEGCTSTSRRPNVGAGFAPLESFGPNMCPQSGQSSRALGMATVSCFTHVRACVASSCITCCFVIMRCLLLYFEHH